MGQAVARIWVTLEQPGADEMVTDAVETLTGRHNATTQRVDKAELSVRRHVRGVTHDTPALYAVVKVAPGVEGKE